MGQAGPDTIRRSRLANGVRLVTERMPDVRSVALGFWVDVGSRDSAAVAEARRRIEQILDPPKAEVGAVYNGKVVNITKFGAFVNILPGRDGLLHISKMGGGKRINQVEDVLDLGDEIEVRVDDVDPEAERHRANVGHPLGDETDAVAQR